MSRRIGYARIPAGEPLDRQIDKLKAAGCSEIFQDEDNPESVAGLQGFGAAAKALQTADTLVICSISNLLWDREVAMIFIGLLLRCGKTVKVLNEEIEERLLRAEAHAAVLNIQDKLGEPSFQHFASWYLNRPRTN